ncbi:MULTISPECIES: BLUF domain-containing protein [Algibacter]|uniref:FAD-dependent sensor of blue light n=1 Tax=Algibacter lectus TaxID=221126 RepID=A0A090WQJ1_9FLAO|nr:BLUF domain-containing protein [Algibacter lectus]MWW26075.1 hypothetical protein [Algibacter lectus]TDY60450.1 FAD-dependent sensor of blue light [Algibacter lectus]SFD72730.1 Sensors of blue-light using FAD [Algibacter lectus]GAL62346.1 hypothetical protein JCM19300_2399 [Algibacter lectus]GAL79286.1 hypothetical protein JCM19274_4371 [Algibacter lectus]
MLKTICYTSTVKPSLSLLEFEALFNETQTRNDRNNITGVLVKKDNLFFQIIEGHPEVIDSLFVQIKKDSRHSKISELLNASISELSFKAFDTGYTVIEDIDTLYGLQLYVAALEQNNIENSSLFLQIIEDLLTVN